MWGAAAALDLPVRGRRRAALAAAVETGAAARADADAVEALLGQRVAERRAALGGYVAADGVFRGGLLVRSEATVASTLAQYPAGAVDFTAVLEALAGRQADEEAWLTALAGAWSVAIAEEEASLDPLPLPGAGGMTAPAGRSLAPSPRGGPAAASTPGAGGGGSTMSDM